MINLKTLALSAFAAAALGGGLAGCTLSEPEAVKGEAEDLRLKAVNCGSMPMIRYTYDTQGRLASMNMAGEFLYELSYQGNSEFPSEVIVKEFEEVYLEDDKYEIKVVNYMRWYNISHNSTSITGFDADETNYDYWSGSEETFKDYYTFTYNASGELTSEEIVEVDQNGNRTVSTTTYDWNDGLLKTADDHESYQRECYTFEYSPVQNQHRQWDPFVEKMGLMGSMGFFGPAPVLFVKAVNYGDGNQVWSVEQYSYSVASNGLIDRMRMMDEDGEIINMNFLYEKK